MSFAQNCVSGAVSALNAGGRALRRFGVEPGFQAIDFNDQNGARISWKTKFECHLDRGENCFVNHLERRGNRNWSFVAGSAVGDESGPVTAFAVQSGRSGRGVG